MSFPNGAKLRKALKRARFWRRYQRKLDPAGALRPLGLRPQLVIDVGVGTGTPWLYALFPKARFLLVDPQDGGDARMIARPRAYEFVNAALGSELGELPIKEQGVKSTFMTRTAVSADAGTETPERLVPVTTLDALLDAHGEENSVGLKVDVEGYELEVMRGLERHRDRMEFVVLEASIRDRFEGAPNFSDVIAWMREHNFRFYNLASPVSAIPPNFYDVVFLREESSVFSRRPG